MKLKSRSVLVFFLNTYITKLKNKYSKCLPNCQYKRDFLQGLAYILKFVVIKQIRLQNQNKCMKGFRSKKQLFVSCNPTLTSFYSKNPYPKVFSVLRTPTINVKHA